MYRLSHSLCIVLLFLGVSGALAQERRVLVIGVDGVRPDAFELAHTPHINSLYENDAGIFAEGYTEDLTFSGPSWSTIINGVHRERHGVESNEYEGHDFTAYPSFLKRLKDFRPDIETAAFVTWGPLQTNFTRTDGTPDGVDHLVYRDRREEGDLRVIEELIRMLEEGDPVAVFLYQNDVDGAGHSHGFSPDVPEYLAQIEKTDALIGEVLDAVRRRPAVRDGSEQWMFIVTTDHGGLGTAHRGNFYVQRHVGFIVSATDADLIEPCFHARNVDVSRTVLTYMGVREEAQAGLDGRAIGFTPCPRPAVAYGENLIFNGDAELDAGFVNASYDQAVTGWYDQQLTGSRDGWHSMTVVRERGRNFFAGGSKGTTSTLIQHVDVVPFQTDIDRREVVFELSAYLGGQAEKSDHMTFTAFFEEENGHILGSALLGPEDRQSETGLVHLSESGVLPAGTRSVRLVLQAHGADPEDAIDAYADNLSFVLTRR